MNATIKKVFNTLFNRSELINKTNLEQFGFKSNRDGYEYGTIKMKDIPNIDSKRFKGVLDHEIPRVTYYPNRNELVFYISSVTAMNFTTMSEIKRVINAWDRYEKELNIN